MTVPKLILTLLPPPLSVDHATLFGMGQDSFADARHPMVDGRPHRPGFEPAEARRAIRLALSAALSRLADPTLQSRISGRVASSSRTALDEFRPSPRALTQVRDQDASAADAIARLAICRVINATSAIPFDHPLRALAGRVLFVDVGLLSNLLEVAEPSVADLPIPLKALLLDHFGAPCVLHVDGAPVRFPTPPLRVVDSPSSAHSRPAFLS